ncbi:hypothetical protein Back11_30370 [Paenibacillus baekrokdamisoli]|uniref:Uncharacterized protein n=1 Tax=Paenibacillus baekrokdamisoli TaxID=1712516 RepID=A0A3G9ITW9_9BACL|nr:hypothetical protein [Paenibacillus baekrokdamisoli]MBB3073071.1 hypothetical protein [Paenibacillus baekrokdamisoli]BBH21692.1 hypothetical protein Back11_30370 [Paenibacillus baekrokdamisoli]
MYICFVEYHINEEFVALYRNWIAEKMAAGPVFKLYEGTDQPHLFVEVWEAQGEASATAIKEERCSERSSWRQMAAWVPGGAPKIHAWTFRPITFQA